MNENASKQIASKWQRHSEELFSGSISHAWTNRGTKRWRTLAYPKTASRIHTRASFCWKSGQGSSSVSSNSDARNHLKSTIILQNSMKRRSMKCLIPIQPSFPIHGQSTHAFVARERSPRTACTNSEDGACQKLFTALPFASHVRTFQHSVRTDSERITAMTLGGTGIAKRLTWLPQKKKRKEKERFPGAHARVQDEATCGTGPTSPRKLSGSLDSIARKKLVSTPKINSAVWRWRARVHALRVISQISSFFFFF